MTSQNYGYNPLMGYDWASLMNNPYFQMAWNTPNVNFRGSSSSDAAALTNPSAASSTASYYNTATTTNPNEGGIPAKPQAQNDSGSTWGTIGTVGTLLAVGGGAWYLIKNGKFGKAAEAVKSALGINTGAKLEKLTATKVGNEVRFMIPNKTVTRSGSGIKDLVDEYKIPKEVIAERSKFNPLISKVETFGYEVGGEKFVVHTENGVITKIIDKDGNEVLKRFTEAQTESADAATYRKMENALKEFVKEKDVDTNMFSGVSNINYTNIYGDDVLKMSIPHYGSKNPTLNQYTTLQRFKFEDDEVQALALSAKEKAFAISDFYKDGKLVDGVKVESFQADIGEGCIGYFENGQLVKIKNAKGTMLNPDSAGFIDIAGTDDIKGKCTKKIESLIEDVFVDRKTIPDGAIIVTA